MLTLVLCETVTAQGTVGSPLPQNQAAVRLTPTEPVLHGLGVVHLSNFYPDRSYKEAYIRALEDLRSNMFISVYLETFKTVGMVKDYEFAIYDSLGTQHAVKLDSLEYRGDAYMWVGFEEPDDGMPDRLTVHRLLPAETWTHDLFGPSREGDYWIASGKEPYSRYDPYRSWAKSKLDALVRLSTVLHTRVESSTRHIDASLRRITYVTSKHFFTNVIVLRRIMRDGYCHTLLAVHASDVIPLQ